MTPTATRLGAADQPAREAALLRARADGLHARGEVEAGGAAHLQALAASTRDPQLVAAAAALVDGNLPVAERLLKRRLKESPSDIGALRMLGELAVRLGRCGDACVLFDKALELAPAFDAARFARALAYSRLSKLPEAIADTDLLIAKAPDNLAYQNLRASILVRLGEFEAARAIYNRVLAARPDQPKIWMSLGHVLKTLGRTADGIEAYRQSLALRPELGESWWSLANLKTFRFEAADVNAMQAALDSDSADEEDRLHLHFALGKASEDASDYAGAFDHYEKGNAIRGAQLQHDADAITRKTRHLRQAMSVEAVQRFRTGGASASDPIFIVGLPRSGSTLIEQILASHPEIEGTMELPDLDKIATRLASKGESETYAEALMSLSDAERRALGEEYLERVGVHRRLGRRFFIDKLPNNWLNVALIHAILPNARIIDARRHPMACCFSGWKQHFARGQSFSYSLRDIGRYYSDYVDLMRHMDAVLPGRVHRVIHERLVEDAEGEVRRLLDYVGVPFDERCLAFHETERAVRTASSEQVRRPISKDGLYQWRHFERWLAPLEVELAGVMESWERL